MNKNSMKFAMVKHGQGWAIADPDNASIRVPVDQLVVDATFVSKDAIEGYILSVHGLDLEIAKLLDRPTLNQLGVGANLRSLPPPPRRGSGIRRVRLEADGQVTDAV